MKPRIAKNLPHPIRREREGMSEPHLAMVRQLPCLGCGRQPPNQPHHLLRTGERGLSRKSSDRWAVPLCFGCHANLHHTGDEDAWFAAIGLDGRAVASALWAARGSISAMERIIFRNRQGVRT